MKENNFLRFISVSAKNDININSLFEEIAENWYNKIGKLEKQQKFQLVLNSKKKKETHSKCVCIKADVIG